jgi:hypothetical protein
LKKNAGWFLLVAWALFLGFLGPFLISADSSGLVIVGTLILIMLVCVTGSFIRSKLDQEVLKSKENL